MATLSFDGRIPAKLIIGDDTYNIEIVSVSTEKNVGRKTLYSNAIGYYGITDVIETITCERRYTEME